jgi:CubicO group peptidase (beta-lactamase class C family)
VRAAEVFRESGARAVLNKALGRPSIPWNVEPGLGESVSSSRFDALIADLADRNTTAFLLAQNGEIVVEWYSDSANPDSPQTLAAVAKALVGTPVLLRAVDLGLLTLDDPASSFITAWSADTLKSTITVEHLASHRSGHDEVHFTRENDDWKATYYENRDERLRMAIEEIPITFPPGSQQSYCGVAYYPLAYVLTKAVAGIGYPDLGEFYAEEILKPLRLPRDAVRLSYGEKYPYDGYTVQAIGSGASMSPRAVLRIGQLLLDRGMAANGTVLSRDAIDDLFDVQPLPPTSRSGPVPLGAHLGWWGNEESLFPSLPVDALVGMGNEDRTVVVIPSENLVFLRLGNHLSDDGDTYDRLEQVVFRPIMGAIRSDQS